MERSSGQTDEVSEGSFGLNQGQVRAQTPLVVEDHPVEGDEGPAADLLEVLDLPPGLNTLRRSEDEVGGDGGAGTDQPGARHDLVDPGLTSSSHFPQPGRAVGFSPVSQPVSRVVPLPSRSRPPSPPHLLAIIKAAPVQEDLPARPGVGQPAGRSV